MEYWLVGALGGFIGLITVLTWVICDTRNQLQELRSVTEDTKDRVIDCVTMLYAMNPKKKGK